MSAWTNVFLILIALSVLGLLILVFLWWTRKRYGILSKKSFYQDTGTHPGQVLYSTSIPLVGKPDYLINQSGKIIPVEIKTGYTPDTPKKHHVMQLLAYCYLVEEIYGVTPDIAILKYPLREFQIGYSSTLRPQIQKIVSDILQMKNNGKEPHCHHPHHNTYHSHASPS